MVIYRIRIRRGCFKRQVPKGQIYGKPKSQGITQLKPKKRIQATAEVWFIILSCFWSLAYVFDIVIKFLYFVTIWFTEYWARSPYVLISNTTRRREWDARSARFECSAHIGWPRTQHTSFLRWLWWTRSTARSVATHSSSGSAPTSRSTARCAALLLHRSARVASAKAAASSRRSAARDTPPGAATTRSPCAVSAERECHPAARDYTSHTDSHWTLCLRSLLFPLLLFFSQWSAVLMME